MPGFFYDDLLRSQDGRIGTDVYADPTKVDPFKWFNFVVKAAPKKGCTVTNTFTKQKEVNAEGGEKWSDKTATKFVYTHDGVKLTFGFANDKFTLAANSEIYNDNDVQIRGDIASEDKPAKDDRKLTVSLDATSPDFGGARLFENLSVEVNKKQEKTIKSKANLRVQDEYNVGVSVEHDTNDFKKILAQGVWNHPNATVYTRADLKRHLANLGCAHTHHGKVHHVYEFTYGWGEGFKGIKGFPVEFRFGGEYNLSDKTTLNTSTAVTEHCAVTNSVSHKVND